MVQVVTLEHLTSVATVAVSMSSALQNTAAQTQLILLLVFFQMHLDPNDSLLQITKKFHG